MTTQYSKFSGLPTGLTLTKKLFTLADPDVVAYTSDSTSERTNAKGEYVFTFGEAAAISGYHTAIVFIGATPIATGKRTFAGTDGETASETPPTVELDPSITTQLDAIEADSAASVGYLTTLVSRLTANAATAIQNLYHMITGAGASSKYTTAALENAPSGGGGGGDATLAKQEEILTVIQGSTVIQVASPNVSGNLVLTQGDDYDGTANPRAQWTVTTDYTSGWTVAFTIRDADDDVVYTTSGTVVSSTVIAVTIESPTGLTMTGCPGQWQGKFDVQLTHTATGKKKTIALGVCYINEDQTR